MTNIEFKIIKWETAKPSYELDVDGKKTLEVRIGQLRDIINEIEKYCRLRFKGELQHSKPKEARIK